MFNTKLFHTMLIVHFSKNSNKPIVNVYQKIIVGLFSALFFGVLLSKGIANAQLPIGIPLNLLFTASLTVGFIIGGFIVLTLYSSESISNINNVFSRIVKMLPISKAMRFIIAVSPILIIYILVGLFIGNLIISASNVMLVPPYKLIIGFFLGLLSGYGFILMKQPTKKHRKAFVFIIIVILNSFLFDKLLTIESSNFRSVINIFIDVMLLIPLIGFYDLYKYGINSSVSNNFEIQIQQIPNKIPYYAWFLVKLWRNKRTRSSFLIALCLSTSGAISIIIRNKTFYEPYQLLLFGAILSSTFACDIRGVMSKNQPPEIVLLSGVKGIIKTEYLSAFICGILIGLPMLLALTRSSENVIHFYLFYFAVQLFSSIVGLLASTIFVPTSSDTGGQFLSALLAISLIFSFPKITNIAEINYPAQSIYWIIGSIIFGFVIYLIELIRRKNYGST